MEPGKRRRTLSSEQTIAVCLDGIIESNWTEVVEQFDQMNLREPLLRGIYGYGFERPSAIQQRAIKPCLLGTLPVTLGNEGVFLLTAVCRSRCHRPSPIGHRQNGDIYYCDPSTTGHRIERLSSIDFGTYPGAGPTSTRIHAGLIQRSPTFCLPSNVDPEGSTGTG